MLFKIYKDSDTYSVSYYCDLTEEWITERGFYTQYIAELYAHCIDTDSGWAHYEAYVEDYKIRQGIA